MCATQRAFSHVSSRIIKGISEAICVNCEKVGAGTGNFISSLYYTQTALMWCDCFERHSISGSQVERACIPTYLLSTPWSCCINVVKWNSILFFTCWNRWCMCLYRGWRNACRAIPYVIRNSCKVLAKKNIAKKNYASPSFFTRFASAEQLTYDVHISTRHLMF